jgi:hypothetical protein
MYEEFAEVQRQNQERDFDDNTYAKLQCYVYVLRSPNDKRIFYIGKAGGRASQGNRRVLEHFDEAEEWLRARSSEPTEKVRKIAEIWRDEEPVEWFVVRHGLTEDVALDVEAALIDTLGISANRETSNIVRGHGAHDRGLLSAQDVAAIAATPVTPNAYKRVFIFQIQNAASSADSLKDAVEGNWKVIDAHRRVDDHPVAVGLVNGVSRIALQIAGWREFPPDSGTYRFEGVPAAAGDLLNKSFVNIIAPALGFLQYGGGYVIVEFDGKGQFRFVRGHKDKTKWHSC